MHRPSHIAGSSSSSFGAAIARGTVSSSNDRAQPSITSGYGAVLEQEHDLQSSTEGCLGAVNGPHSIAIDRILRNQQLQLGINIELLEERNEMLPHPTRFRALRGKHAPLTKRRRTDEPESADRLPDLIAQHLDVLRNITTLFKQRPDGQRGALILAEVARHHEEMAWMLTALLKEDDAARDLWPTPIVAVASPSPTPAPGTAEASWENEGGASPATHPPTPKPSTAT